MIDRARFQLSPNDNEPRFAITDEGQPYVDEAVYHKHKPIMKLAMPNPIAQVLGARPKTLLQPNIIRRTPLRWIKP